VILFGIVAAGVKRGLQRAVTLLMPLLFLLLVGLVLYGMTTEGFRGGYDIPGNARLQCD